MNRLVLIMFFSIVFTACSARFACKDKVNIDGERCDSITEVYEKKMVGDSVPQDRRKLEGDKKELTEDVEAVRSLFYEEEKPIRLPPRIIRIWIAPWEDSDGDLHQTSYIYSEISPKKGRWLFGEKEILTGQPLLRPVEKSSDEKKEDVKGDERAGRKEIQEKKDVRGKGGSRTGSPVMENEW